MSLMFTAEYPAVPKGIFVKQEFPYDVEDSDAAGEFLLHVQSINKRCYGFLTRLRKWLFTPLVSVRVTVTKDEA